MTRVAMLIDESKCTACRGCQVACKQWNDREGWLYSRTRNVGTYENPPDLSPQTWTRIQFNEYEGPKGFQWLFLKEGCMHCGDPPCVKVCPTGALKQHPMGLVTFEEELCNGCGYCSQFCPFDIPRLEASILTGQGKSSKCTFCQDRTTNGLLPACVKTCPAGALSWGDRDEMIVKGMARVEALKGRGYTGAQLYGVNEVGGLGRIYILTAPPSAYGLPEKPSYPALANIWQSIVQPLGEVAFGAAILGVIGAFLISRRNVRMEEVE
ncbi:MAG: 4Fe-4S dicluster domain-containing protein [Anaerolineae bacterium]